MEKIELLFSDLIATLQAAKLYGVAHLRFKKYLDNTYDFLVTVLRDREELVFGIVDNEIAFEKEIFFELSKRLKIMISYLKDRRIERIVFYRGISKKELEHLFEFLSLRKEEVKKDPEEFLAQLHITHIALHRLGGVKEAKDSGTADGTKEEKKPTIGMFSTLVQAYEGSLEQTTDAIERVIEQGDLDYLSLRFSMSHIMEHLIGNYQELLKLASVKRYDFNTFVHMLNVGILSMYFSYKIGFAKSDIVDIGTSALYHDIGKLYISRKIIQKRDRLTDEEFGQMKSHVIIGAELLLKYVETLGVLPVVVSFEHHIKYNSQGYPRLNFYLKPHIASQIVTICDVYDALLARRSYKKSYSPEVVYGIMSKEAGVSFEPKLLEAFFRIMGVWPIGSVVTLTDNSVAVVREVNEDEIFHPLVEVLLPADKSGRLNLKETKGTIEVKGYLDPLTAATDYRHLI